MKNMKFWRTALVAALVLTVMLSVTGGTIAWFTDSATSANNVIKSGNLDIEVQYTLDGKTWNDLDDATDLFQKGLWEPGHTEVVALKVENKGSLALKYNVNMNIVNETIGKTKAGEDIKLSDILTVSALTIEDAGVDPWLGMNIAAMTLEKAFEGEDAIGWGTPAAFNADTVLESDQSLYVGSTQYVFVKVDMAETVGNEANHNGTDAPAIDFGLNVLATQYTHEEDSFGNQYDASASYDESPYVDNADEVFEAFSSFDQSGQSGTVVLRNDYSTADAQNHWSSNREYALRAEGTDVTFDMNGKKVTHDTTYQNGQNTGYTYLFTTAYNGKLTVSGNGSVHSTNADGNTCIFYAQGPSEIVINDGEYHTVSGVPVWAGNNATITINGGKFTSSDSSDQELIYSSGGVIYIKGGFFHNTGWDSRPVNVADANRATGYIYISGGTFVNFDPSTGGDDPNNILVEEGYKVVSETQDNGDIWYTVVAK